ncbi:MAG TPA: GNAT family N-acetyltransferase [Clostridiales bacterium]|nr:GNAT family N-acetyltransferase [Clostridiales bacterium]
MTNKEILRIAMEQSALDLNCSPDDFLRNDHVVVVNSKLGPSAKKFYKDPITCIFASYGSNIVVSVKEGYSETAEEYINKFEHYHCFETPNIYWLNERLAEKGQKVCFMSEYFLPDINKLRPLPCEYEMRFLEPQDFAYLYKPEWSNALCESRKNLDMLCVGAYDGDRLIGLAGCSADCEQMWQIGVDVLPECRKKGIGSALTSRLAVETLERGKVPFYCCAWSNIRSARNAVKSGFVPAWAEMTVTPKETVDELNR